MPTNKTPPVRISLEPEIQYKAPLKLIPIIEDLLISTGAKKASSREGEKTYYWDTKNFRLFRQGMECRGRSKNGGFRFDLKVATGSNPTALPDKDGILWRYELKAPSDEPRPDLKVFFDHVAVPELRERLRDVYSKEVEPKFVAIYDKTKFEREITVGGKTGLIEYSLQSGYIRTLNGRQRTRTMGIVDVELRSGANEAHLQAKTELETLSHLGLVMLPRRKLIMGMDLIVSEQDGKAYERVLDTLSIHRNHRRQMREMTLALA
ncbi:MAG: hypothetical protein WBK55_06195 [Alphaproteobacteria bacterium]